MIRIFCPVFAGCFALLRDDFDLQFAESGREALKVMEGAEFDAVVSDMRMPGMDGADLLKKVQSLYPCTIRIMLTGQADEDAILRTVGVVHQFLEKPSDPEIVEVGIGDGQMSCIH